MRFDHTRRAYWSLQRVLLSRIGLAVPMIAGGDGAHEASRQIAGHYFRQNADIVLR